MIGLGGEFIKIMNAKIFRNASRRLSGIFWLLVTGWYENWGGSYDIPLKAAYYQTGSEVLPGTANTSVNLVMWYE
ncbi:hypothetical protein [Ralstonia sp. UBA689]|uniref:hypothetical protein n=1 Tax=Ralstonia sp. UBA689 TaxID=1947373 RepID=UPI0025F6BE37|nr:hypothetical protein [Ralstonia sp. UBA689]